MEGLFHRGKGREAAANTNRYKKRVMIRGVVVYCGKRKGITDTQRAEKHWQDEAREGLEGMFHRGKRQRAAANLNRKKN